MVMSSLEIAQMNGAFMQQSMMQAQMGAMRQPTIGSMMGPPEHAAGNMMGRAMNVGSAVAGPALMGGMALAGLDPVSLGMSTAFGASRMGMGFMGAGMAGLGVGAAAYAPIMAAQYAGTQFMTGAQQQQGLNQALRSSYTFMNPASMSGTGFSTSQMGQIGSTMRGMAGQFGPGGEMVGFEELSRLAANMGRMGMSQGVRDVKEFSSRFKEMVGALKEIATAFNTNLEQAQQVMSSMRSSGIFGAGKSAQMAQLIRGVSAGTGLATTEVMAMMNIGSQISRSIGGRGQSGAMGGIRAISNLGGAMEAGVISEEDVYNVTGLTGAEGRQAYASGMLQNSARFLKGGLGRRFLASIAGRNGTLDESSVAEWEGGGVGTGRTMQMAHRNLANVGRANFIRNEGRLRGAALGRFGELAGIMSMRSWLEERGIDVNEDADRAMIFLQRREGLGRDEADQMVRYAQRLPEIMRGMKDKNELDKEIQALRHHRSTHGIEGLKKKLEKARANVQNTLQQAGAEFYQEGTSLIESYIAKLSGEYEVSHSTMAREAFRSAYAGNAEARSMMMGSLGTSVSRQRAIQNANAIYGTAGSMGKLTPMQAALDKGFSSTGMFSGLAAEDKNLLRGQMDEAIARRSVGGTGDTRLKGWEDFFHNSTDPTSRAVSERLKAAGSKEARAQIISNALHAAGRDHEAQLLGAGGHKPLMGSSGHATQRDKDAALGEFIFAKEHVSGERVGGALIGLGIGAVGTALGGPMGAIAGAYGKEAADRLGISRQFDRLGQDQLRRLAEGTSGQIGGLAWLATSTLAAPVEGLGKVLSGGRASLANEVGKAVAGESRGLFGLTRRSVSAAVANVQHSDEYQSLAMKMLANVSEGGGMYAPGKEAMDTVNAKLTAELDKGDQKNSSVVEAYTNLKLRGELASLGPNPSREQIEALIKTKQLKDANDRLYSPEDLIQRADSAEAAVRGKQKEYREQEARRITEGTKQERSAMLSRGGLFTEDGGKLTLNAGADVLKKDWKSSRAKGMFVEMMQGAAQKHASLEGLTDAGDIVGVQYKSMNQLRALASKATDAELREMGMAAKGEGADDQAEFLLDRARTGETISKRQRRFGKTVGGVGAAAELLGGSVDMRSLLKKSRSGKLTDAELMQELESGLGVSAKQFGGLHNVLEAAKGGNKDALRDAVEGLQGDQTFKKAQKDRKMAEQEAKDPLQAEIKSLLGKVVENTKKPDGKNEQQVRIVNWDGIKGMLPKALGGTSD